MSLSSFAIDTNAAVALMASDAAIQSRLGIGARLFMPLTVLGELYFGAEGSARANENALRVDAFCRRLNLLPIDIETARLYGKINQSLRVKGRPINDMWIAATSLRNGLVLVTRDKHFHNISELSTIDG
jgi:tRNA(fMet)-specific endonuclease VapC